MTASEGLALVLAYAVTLIASVLLAGILVDVPWMLLPFFGLATALMSVRSEQTKTRWRMVKCRGRIS